MGKMNRRTFLRNTTGALAASAFLPGMGAAEAPALTATTRRTLGKSGLSCSLLGIGTGTRGRDGATDQTQSVLSWLSPMIRPPLSAKAWGSVGNQRRPR